MKKKNFFIGAFIMTAVSCMADSVYFQAEVTSPDGTYRKGEDITIMVNKSGTDEPVFCDARHSSMGMLATGLKQDWYEYRFPAPEKPGHVLFTLTCGNMRLRTGALVQPEAIRPAMPIPDDADAFWDAQLEALRKLPFEVKTKVVDPPDPESYAVWRKTWRIFRRGGEEPYKDIEVREVEINTLKGNPVRGYIAWPAGAKPKSLPAILTFPGAGVDTSDFEKVCSAAHNGFLAMDFNVHGLLNKQPAAYYEQYRTTTLKDYFRIKCDKKEESYMLEIALRVLRGVDYLTSLPEWDGKNLCCWGASQGGWLSLLCASLNPKVTKVAATVPAFCDCDELMTHFLFDWGTTSPEQREHILKEIQYFTIAAIGHRAKAQSIWIAGLIDDCCPAETILAGYNNYAGPKKLYTVKNGNHGSTPEHLRFDLLNTFLKQGLVAP